LIRSINQAIDNNIDVNITLVVFDDHSGHDYKTSIENICGEVKCESEIRTTRKQGQGESLLEQFEFARQHNALFYFCEDDYLHEASAVSEMCLFYRQIFEICKTHSVIHPQEHDFLYSRHIYPSYVLLGEKRHWRTISHATHTLFLHSTLVADHWEYFENTRFVGDRKKRRLGVESRTTNHLFNHYPGFAPIPALAAHMQTQQSLPPFFNWQSLWEINKPE
jgi:glycosyltransferase involved in cell wall biosynthesis